MVSASRLLQRRERAGAEPSQKRVRLAVTAEQHVLAVVDALAGLAIGERRRAAAKPRRLLDDDDAPAGVDEPDGGAEAGEAGADDDDVGGHAAESSTRS